MTLIHVPRYFLGTLHANLFSQNEPAQETFLKAIYWTSVFLICHHFGILYEFGLYWLVPFFTTFQVIRYWVEMAEHAGLRSNNPLESSRNSFGNVAERFILQPHHDCYHLAHHLLPSIPHFNLKKAHLTLMKYQPYAEAHHCLGFFSSLIPGFQTVIEDIRGPHLASKTRFS
jgi:fatty acid desaturase